MLLMLFICQLRMLLPPARCRFRLRIDDSRRCRASRAMFDARYAAADAAVAERSSAADVTLIRYAYDYYEDDDAY